MLQQLKKDNIEAHEKWVNDGKPRDSECESRRLYKSAKQKYRAEYRRAEREYEMKNEAEIDQQYFWHLVRKARRETRKSL